MSCFGHYICILTFRQKKKKYNLIEYYYVFILLFLRATLRREGARIIQQYLDDSTKSAPF